MISWNYELFRPSLLAEALESDTIIRIIISNDTPTFTSPSTGSRCRRRWNLLLGGPKACIVFAVVIIGG